MFILSATLGASKSSTLLRASLESDAAEACRTPPATCDGFFVRSVVGINIVAADLAGAAGFAAAGLAPAGVPRFLGGGGGGLAPGGSSPVEVAGCLALLLLLLLLPAAFSAGALFAFAGGGGAFFGGGGGACLTADACGFPPLFDGSPDIPGGPAAPALTCVWAIIAEKSGSCGT